MTLNLQNKKRLVIKLGSSLLVENNKIRMRWLKNFVKNVADFIKNGSEIILVSSGALAVGRSFLKQDGAKLSLEERRASAAVGQVQLSNTYQKLFKKLNINIAQILLTASDCNSRERYLTCKNTIDTLLKGKIIPIINENDPITVDEIKIGDNDRLAARITQMTSADLMILFSDIDGLYNKNPRTEKSAKLIAEVFSINKEIEKMAGGSGSLVGTGGMITKIKAAKMLMTSGCDSVITNGFEKDALKKLVDGSKKCTVFYSKNKNNSASKSRKTWLAGFLNPKGEIIVNECAKVTLRQKNISLLAVGAIAVNGNFDVGDVVFVKDESGSHIASGVSNYSSLDVQKILGKKSEEVLGIFGQGAKKELIHIDNLVIIS